MKPRLGAASSQKQGFYFSAVPYLISLPLCPGDVFQPAFPVAFMTFLNRFFQLRENEVPLVLTLSFILLSNSVAQKISEISAISNFINDVGVSQLLVVWVIDGLLLLLTTGVQSLLVDRFSRLSLIRGVTLGVAIAYIILRLMFFLGAPNWLNYALFYLFSQQQAFFLPLVVWLIAGDLFDVAQSKRLFPLISNWELVGNLGGIGIAAIAPFLLTALRLPLEELLTINILIYLISLGVIQLGFRKVRFRKSRQKVEGMKESLTEGWEFVQEVPAFRYLTIALLSIWICDTIAEFYFLVVSEAAIANASSYQTFYSMVVLARILGYMAIQGFLTQRILSEMGLKNSFLISPIASLTGMLCMLGIPGLAGGISGIFVHKLPLFSVTESSIKTLQSMVPDERRGRVSIFMDSYLNAGGSVLSCILMGVIILSSVAIGWGDRAFYLYIPIGVLFGVLAIWAVFKMREVYDSSLLNWRLKRRQRGKSVLDNIDF